VHVFILFISNLISGYGFGASALEIQGCVFEMLAEVALGEGTHFSSIFRPAGGVFGLVLIGSVAEADRKAGDSRRVVQYHPAESLRSFASALQSRRHF
jgi:hypothetical protein